MSKRRVIVTGASGFIGTNYMEYLIGKGDDEYINIDIRPPRNSAHDRFWKKCDIMDADLLKRIVKEFSPTHVAHLAAKTGIDVTSLEDFAPNIQGVENLINALQEAGTVERAIFTSTMLVCGRGYVPKHDTDYKPVNLYGESKVRGEKIVRAHKDLNFTWTITRPIGVWGPWEEEPYRSFFRFINKGLYVHPGSGHYKKRFGYVGNIVHEMESIFKAPKEKVSGKTMYVSDDVVDLYDFAEEIRRALGAKKIRHIPYWIVRSAAIAGDVLKKIGWEGVPFTTFKLDNMTRAFNYDLSPIMEISAPLPFSMKEGIARTIEHMRKAGEL